MAALQDALTTAVVYRLTLRAITEWIQIVNLTRLLHTQIPSRLYRRSAGRTLRWHGATLKR